MCCERCSVRQQKIWVITLGVICVAVGTVLVVIWPGVTKNIISNEKDTFYEPQLENFIPFEQKLQLSPASWIYQHWLHPPMTAYMFVYLFNWTNMYDATNRNVMPNFSQLGPYVFREEKLKEEITSHENDTLTFYGRRTWFFEKNMSIGTLNDLVTLHHPPTVVAANKVRNWNCYVKKIMNYALNSEGGLLAVNQSVEEWLFKGFYDPLAEFAMLLESKLIPWRYENFGKEYEGAYTNHTGQRDLSKLGELSHWQGSAQSYGFRGECGRLNGSTGDIIVPARGPAETVSSFLPDACRSINMFPVERARIRGMDTVKYYTNSMSFDSGELYQNMECFCAEKDDSCAFDFCPCLYSSPLYLPQPHFCNADSNYTVTVTGINLKTERELSVPVKVNASMQISMLLGADEIIEIFKNLNEFYAPFMIISERGELSGSMARTIGFVGCSAVLFVVGVTLLITAIYLIVTYKWKEQRYYI